MRRFRVPASLLYILSKGYVASWGRAVALRYKPEGCEFDSRWCHWNFSLINSSGLTMVLGSIQPLTEMSTTHIFGGKGGRCVGLTTLPLSCADFLEIWEPQFPGTLKACPGRYRDCFAVTFYLSSQNTSKPPHGI